MQEEYLLLIDGSSLLTTQFFGNLPREILFEKDPKKKELYYHKIMMTKKGVYTNAVFGFLRTLFKIIKEQKPTYLAVAWDLTRDTFRRRLYPEYKGNRSETMKPLSEQFDTCQKVLEELGIKQLMDLEYEADDFCGSVAKKFEQDIPVKIFTKDHDYLQLVNEHTHMWLMHSTAEKTEEMYAKYKINHAQVNVPDRAFELTPELVEAEFGIKPQYVNSLKGIQGDSSDNISGVPGVGEKTAVKLIQIYGTVDALYADLRDMNKEKEAEIKAKWKDAGITRAPLKNLLAESEDELVGEKAARLSELLATIKTDIDLGALCLQDMKIDIKKENAEKVLDDLEFASLSLDFLDEETPEEDITEKFLLADDINVIPSLEKNYLKEKELGIYYEREVGLALSKKDGDSVFFPELFFVTDFILADLVKKFADAGIKLYTFSGKALEKLAGIETIDIGIGAYLLNPLKSDYPYEEVAKTYLNRSLKSEKELLGKVSKTDAKMTLANELADVMCSYAWTAMQASESILLKLEEEGMTKLFFDIELPCMGALSRMETAGIQVKREALVEFSAELKAGIENLEKEIYALAGRTFNINSPKQLGEVLFDELKLPYGKKTKSGYSTAAEILEKLAEDYPIVQKVLDFRTLAKLKSTYADGLQEYISADGRIHGTFNQTITATGRISSTSPNLQNIPVRLALGREIRKVFVPKDGCVFIDADYSQIELRVLADISGDENLIEAYRSARDIHALTASQVFHVPLDEVTPAMRSNAKAVNFGIVYGISAFSLSEDLSITRQEAKEYMESYFAAYPKIQGFLNAQVENAKKNGYVTTLYGRKRPIPELESMNFNQRSFGERVAMNSPIQGTAADIMKIAMVRVESALKAENLKSKIVLQIHDELIIEALEEEADQVEELLVREMQHAAELKVNLDVEAKRGKSWYETK